MVQNFVIGKIVAGTCYYSPSGFLRQFVGCKKIRGFLKDEKKKMVKSKLQMTIALQFKDRLFYSFLIWYFKSEKMKPIAECVFD